MFFFFFTKVLFFSPQQRTGTTYFHQTSMVSPIMAATSSTNRLTGIRPNRFRRNKRAAERMTNAEPDPLSMFQALLTISKGYVQLGDLSIPPV